MAHPLDGVNAKLKRAITHLDQLQRDIRAFAALEPYTVRLEEHATDSGAVEIVFVVVDRHMRIDAGISLLAGEAIYQLRSALDHLIHQLVILNGQGAKLANSRRHQFPIFETTNGYQARAGDMIDGVSDAARDLIVAAQPYNGPHAHAPKADALWILQDLNNTDKHRVIPVSVVALDILRARESVDDITFADMFTVSGFGPLHDGDVLGRLPKSDPYIDAQLTCTIAFEKAGALDNRPIVPLIRRLYVWVGKVIDQFRAAF